MHAFLFAACVPFNKPPKSTGPLANSTARVDDNVTFECSGYFNNSGRCDRCTLRWLKHHRNGSHIILEGDGDRSERIRIENAM